MTELNREVLVKKYGKDNLINLTEIYLSRRQIRYIDFNTFKGLTKLEKLELYKNEIEEIDVRLFETLSNLKSLWLYNNKLKRIDFNTFKGLDKLEILLLSSNEIEEIDVRLFESLLNLKKLFFDNNKLKRIDLNTFKGLTKLELLRLDDNKIEEIEVGSFDTLSNLKWLYLNNNKLKSIDRKCFEPLKSIEYIGLYLNVDLNVQTFDINSNSTKNSLLNIVKKGKISNWNTFLKQFPKLDNQKEAKKIEQKPRQEKETANRQKIAEANSEQDNVKKPSFLLSSSIQSTNNEGANKFQDPNVGLLLKDRYKIVRKLGKGSFGLVYLINDTKVDIKKVKEKAVKIMDQFDSATDNELVLLSEINHDSIVRYFDHFHLENQTFLITEYCENGDLKNKIENTKRLGINFSDKQILDWISQATNGLNYLHSKKPKPIIHRDIKPANMLLSERNEVKLADLGLSKLLDNTHASSHAGTPMYMSPEVFKAQFMDIKYYPNADIWSLGCVLYELKFLTVAFPIGQRGNPSIPSKVSTSGIFSSILQTMLEKDCLARITSRRLLAELENISIE